MLASLETLLKSKAWPLLEAQKVLTRINSVTPKKGYVLFETGYGPSGLPHIGTFGEVARTSMVRAAFQTLSDIPTKLICFSDDLDGLRKVPSNVPNQKMLAKYIDYPLTSIPDPFEQVGSYGEYMNLKLQSFLDKFNFEYTFYSATKCYKSGMFDHMMLKVLEKYEEIMEVMLPTFREERRSTYSPFMPVCPDTGKILQIPIKKIDKKNGSVTYINNDGQEIEVSVTGGKCKLQWKPDFAMRWAALDVDYEMYGKDHMPNGPIYSQICTILGNTPPIQFFYELFLNQDGEKISKSKGNSISVDEWLCYAPIESMLLFMYQSPSKAKKLYFDVIPKAVDEYLTYIKKYHETDDLVTKLDNPVYHIHAGKVPQIDTYKLSFSLLLNLASACNPENKRVLWGFISKYAPNASSNRSPYLDHLVEFAIKYYDDFIKKHKQYLSPSEQQKLVLKDLLSTLDQFTDDTDSEIIQSRIYKIGVKYGYSNLRDYFKEIYQILLGQSEGPRLGSFIRLFGIKNTQDLIKEKLQ